MSKQGSQPKKDRVFPDERYWIDFKRALYPRRPDAPAAEPTPGERKSAHRELARDAASMATRGGYLIYGVHEDRADFRFDPVGMPLEPGIRETVDEVVSTRTSPSLAVVTHLLHRPDDRGTRFLVVEIPESSDAPHMVEGVFHGRSDTGRTTLDEPEVERLILQRHRQQDRLVEAMALTAEYDPGVERRENLPRAYLTAVPTRGHRDTFRPFTDPRASREKVWRLCHAAQQTTQPSGRGDRDLVVEPYARRGQRIGGVWHRTWDEASTDDGGAWRALGISDDGEIRYLRFRAGLARATGREEADMIFAGRGQRPDAVAGVLFDSHLLWYVHAVNRLVGVLASEVGYTGSWSIGLEVHGLHRYVSERHHRSLDWGIGSEVQILDDDRYRHTTRATTAALQADPFHVAATLTRSLLRGLDHETLLDGPHSLAT